jgi:4-hydroxy-2-oxoheptanedioate aldolase
MSIPNRLQQYTYENASHLHVKAPFRPAQLTQSHNLKGLFRLMKDDPSKAIFGVGQGIPSVFLSKVLAQAGADFVWMDGEHSLWDRSAIHE